MSICYVSASGSLSPFLSHEVDGELLYSFQSQTKQQPPTLLQYQSYVNGPALMPYVEQRQHTLPQKYSVLPPITAYAAKPMYTPDNVQRVCSCYRPGAFTSLISSHLISSQLVWTDLNWTKSAVLFSFVQSWQLVTFCDPYVTQPISEVADVLVTHPHLLNYLTHDPSLTRCQIWFSSIHMRW